MNKTLIPKTNSVQIRYEESVPVLAFVLSDMKNIALKNNEPILIN